MTWNCNHLSNGLLVSELMPVPTLKPPHTRHRVSLHVQWIFSYVLDSLESCNLPRPCISWWETVPRLNVSTWRRCDFSAHLAVIQLAGRQLVKRQSLIQITDPRHWKYSSISLVSGFWNENFIFRLSLLHMTRNRDSGYLHVTCHGYNRVLI